MLPYSFYEEAEEELDHAIAVYQRRSPVARVAFVAEVDHVIDIIRTFPALGVARGDGVRSVPLRKYPYTVVYLPEDARLVIIAIAHQRRRPGYWRGRIRQP